LYIKAVLYSNIYVGFVILLVYFYMLDYFLCSNIASDIFMATQAESQPHISAMSYNNVPHNDHHIQVA